MLKQFMSNEFNKNVLKLMTGATIAQAIPVAISPILTRLYTPEDFGVLTIFIALTAIFGSIVNARYELAIVLPEKEEDSINLVALSILIAIFISSLLLVAILLFKNSIILLLGNDQIGLWLYFVPLTVLFIGIFNSLNYLNTRLKMFGVIAKVKVVKSVSLAIVQLGLGFLKVGAGGLVSGQIVSHVFANGKLAKEVFSNKALLSYIRIKDMVRLGKRYSSFPKYSMGAVLANNLSQHLISFFLPALYSISSVGFYGLVNRILGMPSTIIGNSVGQVFFQRASEEKLIHGNAKATFNSTLKKLLIISTPLFIIFFIAAEDLVAFVFGEDWREAGLYSSILAPLFMIRFINTPLSTITSIFEKNHVALIMQLSYLIVTIVLFLIAYYFRMSIIHFLVMYSVVLFLYNCVRLFIFKRISTGEE
ncbi:oligosaccharide flippase family protein [Oceanobacillus sp. FSL K6-2867]|uniref:oligosaccharide flippase family protein n=1 Tax=Oceanobacillus sp. FSL K6-2867 TaxID=2954748 RepID=UPI0030DDCA04